MEARCKKLTARKLAALSNSYHLSPGQQAEVLDFALFLTRTSRNQTGKTKEGKFLERLGQRHFSTSQRLENEVSIKLPQKEVETFPRNTCSTTRQEG